MSTRRYESGCSKHQKKKKKRVELFVEFKRDYK